MRAFWTDWHLRKLSSAHKTSNPGLTGYGALVNINRATVNSDSGFSVYTVNIGLSVVMALALLYALAVTYCDNSPAAQARVRSWHARCMRKDHEVLSFSILRDELGSRFVRGTEFPKVPVGPECHKAAIWAT